MDKHLDGAWDIFWIKSGNDTFIAFQMKAFGTKKNSNYMHGLKSAILPFLKNCQFITDKWDNFKKPLVELKKIFLFWHRMNLSKAWSVELEVGIFLAN